MKLYLHKGNDLFFISDSPYKSFHEKTKILCKHGNNIIDCTVPEEIRGIYV